MIHRPRCAMRSRLADDPKSRFDATDVEYDDGEGRRVSLRLYADATKTILSRNDSPDVGFRWSVNPYRGCVHACAYCYARSTHEYLGFGAGSEFDTQIVHKPNAAALLREAMMHPRWRGETLVFSGVTDCYQPIESKLRLTRACLEVCAELRNPVGIITKSTLVERDLDVLHELTAHARVHVVISVPFLDEDHARAIEPWAPTPTRRLRTIEKLAAAGIPVGINVAPIVPGLSDSDVIPLLEAAAAAGARDYGWVMLRLPGATRPVFEARLREALPLRAEHVLSRIRDTRSGHVNDTRWHDRMRGEGPYADAIVNMIEATARRVGLTARGDADDTPTTFTRPSPQQEATRRSGQLGLFE
jgi:DNA repair photolyase